MKRFFPLLLLCGFAAFPVEGQQLEFFRENVVFHLDAEHLNVTAELWFKNPNEKIVNQTIHIPFACEGSEYKTDSLLVTDCSANEEIKTFRQNIAGALVQVSVLGNEQKKVKVTYIQNHDGKRAGYILTKVKYWTKPLREASYTLIVESPRIRIDSTSIRPDATSTDDGKVKQSWKKSNFSPKKELCFYFHLE